jgi:hypothetical protein
MSSGVSDYVYINILAIIVLYLIDKSTKTIIEQQNIKLNYEKNLIENLGSE